MYEMCTWIPASNTMVHITSLFLSNSYSYFFSLSLSALCCRPFCCYFISLPFIFPVEKLFFAQFHVFEHCVYVIHLIFFTHRVLNETFSTAHAVLISHAFNFLFSFHFWHSMLLLLLLVSLFYYMLSFDALAHVVSMKVTEFPLNFSLIKNISVFNGKLFTRIIFCWLVFCLHLHSASFVRVCLCVCVCMFGLALVDGFLIEQNSNKTFGNGRWQKRREKKTKKFCENIEEENCKHTTKSKGNHNFNDKYPSKWSASAGIFYIIFTRNILFLVPLL